MKISQRYTARWRETTEDFGVADPAGDQEVPNEVPNEAESWLTWFTESHREGSFQETVSNSSSSSKTIRANGNKCVHKQEKRRHLGQGIKYTERGKLESTRTNSEESSNSLLYCLKSGTTVTCVYFSRLVEPPV